MKLRKQKAFTLIELLIVVLIIGILSAVTLRAIEMTRERTMYTDSIQKIFTLVKAITGNPDLLADGKRVDFGFFGDMGRLPITLNELVRNTENNSNWHGPYIKIAMLEDTLNPSYKIDAWGNEVEYNYATGTLRSRGNGRQTLSYNIADSLSFLFSNRIRGLVTDNLGNPPGSKQSLIDIIINLPNGSSLVHPSTNGTYQFENVPIGKHLVQAIRRTATAETLVKWVSVVPKSNNIIDFRFSQAFQSSLKYKNGTAIADGDSTANVRFDVYNDAGETLKIFSLKFARIVPPKPYDTIFVYCDSIYAIDHTTYATTLIHCHPPATWRPGSGYSVNTVNITPELIFAPAGTVTFALHQFWNHPTSDTLPQWHKVNMDSSDFQITFSDGSIISFIARESLP